MTSLSNGTTVASIPDLTPVLDQIDFSKKPLSHGRQGSKKSRFSVAKWGSLIIELIAYPEEEANILNEFGLSRNQYAELKGNKLFQTVWKETESSIVALATNGGFQLNARRLAEQSLNVLEDILEGASPKEQLKASELIARLANVDPLIQSKMRPQDQQTTSGVQLVVNVSPALPMPSGFKTAGEVIIDAEVVKDEER